MTVSAPTRKPEYIACSAPVGTKERLEEFRKQQGLRSCSAAAVALIERGLQQAGLY